MQNEANRGGAPPVELIDGERLCDLFETTGVQPPFGRRTSVWSDLNPRTVLLMAADGRLPASQLPGSRKFHFFLEDVLDTLKQHRVAPSPLPPTRAPRATKQRAR